MTKKIIIFLALSLFTLNPYCSADSEKNFSGEDVKQFMTNSAFSFMDKDTISSLYVLAKLDNVDVNSVIEMQEIQLDIIVCSAWEVKEKLNEPSRKRNMDLLRKIREYRQKKPRKPETTISQEQLKKLFPGAIESGIDYTERAKTILAELQ